MGQKYSPLDSRTMRMYANWGPVETRGVMGSLPCGLRLLVPLLTDESEGLEWLCLTDTFFFTTTGPQNTSFPLYPNSLPVSSSSSPDKRFLFVSQANSSIFLLDSRTPCLHRGFCPLIIIFLLSICCISFFTGTFLGLLLLSITVQSSRYCK